MRDISNKPRAPVEPHVVLIEDWPQPDAETPAVVTAGGNKLMICYGSHGQFVVLSLSYYDMKIGGPNDEAFNGHPLYKFGLRDYSIHRIENSPWLHDLERQNSVHPSHTREKFMNGKVHYLLGLKEETIECIANGTDVQFEHFSSSDLALEYMRAHLIG